MNTPRKSIDPKETTQTPDAAQTALPITFDALFGTGIQRVAEISNTCLNLAATQNAELMDAYKNMIRMTLAMPAAMPAVAAADLLQRSVERIIRAQKDILEVAAKPLARPANSGL